MKDPYAGECRYLANHTDNAFGEIVGSGIVFIDQDRAFGYRVNTSFLLKVCVDLNLQILPEVRERPFDVRSETYKAAAAPTQAAEVDIFKVILTIAEVQLGGEVLINVPVFRVTEPDGSMREVWFDIAYSLVGVTSFSPVKLCWSCYKRMEGGHGR